MPAPGGANNGLGINSFSGPMGQKEPAYGTSERMKILSRIGVTAPPAVDAAKRSAARGRRAQTQAAPPPPTAVVPEQAPVASYGQQLAQFWTQLASTPGASPLVQELAAQVENGG